MNKRFKYGRVFLINSDDSLPVITDTKNDKDYFKMLDIVDLLNEQQIIIEGLLLDRNRQEEKLDIAREKMRKQVKQIKRDEVSMNTMIKNLEKIKKENNLLMDYIDTIFEGNTHICKHLDVEDVEFYCKKDEYYRNPSCLYEKCFDERNLVELNSEIKRCFE